MNFSENIKIINDKIAKNGSKIKIEKRGKTLSFRGILPSKENSNLTKYQRISLNLPADLEGLKKSEKLLELLLLQLQHNQFNWSNWNRSTSKKKGSAKNSLNEAIKNFEAFFFKEGSSASKRTTWDSAYKPYLKKLEILQDKKNYSINPKLFFETLETYQLNSRSRLQCSSSLGIFAKFLNIELSDNWKKIALGYGLKQYNYRELPSDEKIIALWEQIPNPEWKLVFGVMATYGLRNHEVFFSDFSSIKKTGDKVIRVLPTTKTGEHEVWPFHPEWVDLFQLEKLSKDKNHLPQININLSTTTLQKVGRRVSEQFRRYKLPITPYYLRHAWAVRTILIGLPDTVSARMMGHSVSIHNRTYHHWITRRDQQKAVDAVIDKI